MLNRNMVAGLLTLMLASGSAFAQESDRPKQEGDAPKGQDEAKKKKGQQARAPFGLPSLKDLKEKLELDEEQCKKIEIIYKESGKKMAELRKKIKDGADRKSLGKEFRGLRTGIFEQINAVLNEEQQKKFKELVPQRGKKKKTDKPADKKPEEKTDN